MDMRQYDPAIARWTSIDPVTHHSMSTYTAFDNNPIFWADPSGANSRAYDDINMDSKEDNAEFDKKWGSTTYYGGGLSMNRNGFTASGNTKTYKKYESETIINYQFNGNIGSEEDPVYEHLITESTTQKVSELSEDFKRITVSTITTTNYLLIRVSKADNGGSNLSYASQEVVSDLIEDQYSAGDKPFHFELGKPLTAGYIRQLGFTKDEAHSNSAVWGYGNGLKQNLNDYGYDYNPYNNKTSLAQMTQYGSGVVSFFISLTKVATPIKIGISAGVLLGNSYRIFANHSGRSDELDSETKTFYRND
tara:strand:- start:11017 stop:11934 length:918 start_codon:yes stop_codon:yes gene_type:complete